MKRFIYCLLISLTFLMSQEPCEGTCLSEEETKNLFNNIQECEFDKENCLKKVQNLDSQIYMYIQMHENDSLLISLNEQKSILLNERIKLYDDLIKEVKPKWYENKWLWFTIGVLTTAGSVKLAGEIID